jgi:hypothetical protein
MATNTKWQIAASILLCLLFLAACGDSNEPRDTGPNAGLSDQTLLTKAVADMRALKSYHFDVTGTFPSVISGRPSDAHIFGDMQTDDKGSRIRATNESNTANSGPTPGSTAVASESGVDVILAKGDWYESYDGGNTWNRPQIDTPAYLFIGTFGLIWDARYSFGSPTTGEQMIKQLAFKDDSSTVESIDGVMTRHMLAEPNVPPEIGEASAWVMEGAKTISIWVSTDITPTIRQMTVDGIDIPPSDGANDPASATATLKENGQPPDKPYHLTWKWSRFNEDFGVINPPPPEKINTPVP